MTKKRSELQLPNINVSPKNSTNPTRERSVENFINVFNSQTIEIDKRSISSHDFQTISKSECEKKPGGNKLTSRRLNMLNQVKSKENISKNLNKEKANIVKIQKIQYKGH